MPTLKQITYLGLDSAAHAAAEEQLSFPSRVESCLPTLKVEKMFSVLVHFMKLKARFGNMIFVVVCFTFVFVENCSLRVSEWQAH